VRSVCDEDGPDAAPDWSHINSSTWHPGVAVDTEPLRSRGSLVDLFAEGDVDGSEPLVASSSSGSLATFAHTGGALAT